jgi:hypothetical protein
MVDTNFSVNAAGNLAQYNLVTNKEETKDTITADDIKVMIKLGQFNKVRGLIRELENSSPDDKAAAQKIAAFAEFYKEEVQGAYSDEYNKNVLNSNDGRGADGNIIGAHVYERYADILDKYNVSSYGYFGVPDNFDKILTDDIADEGGWPKKGGIINEGRTLTLADIGGLIYGKKFDELYSLMQDLKKINENLSNNDKANISAIQKEIARYAYKLEHARQFHSNSKILIMDGKVPPFSPFINLSSESKATELADFFEAKGDTETANKIRAEIKEISDSREKELAESKKPYLEKEFILDPELLKEIEELLKNEKDKGWPFLHKP